MCQMEKYPIFLRILEKNSPVHLYDKFRGIKWQCTQFLCVLNVDDDALFVVWLIDERRLALFLAGTIVRNPYLRKYLTHHQLDFKLHRT